MMPPDCSTRVRPAFTTQAMLSPPMMMRSMFVSCAWGMDKRLLPLWLTRHCTLKLAGRLTTGPTGISQPAVQGCSSPLQPGVLLQGTCRGWSWAGCPP